MRDGSAGCLNCAAGLLLVLCTSCARPMLRSSQAALSVTNGGFEETQRGPAYTEILVDGQWTGGSVDRPQPPGWLTRVFAGDVQPGLDSRVRHRGKYSATLISRSPRQTASANLYQALKQNLQKGQDYTVTFWVKKTPLAKAGIGVWSDAGAQFESQAYWDFQADFTRWHEIQFCFQAQRTTTAGFWIMLSLEGVAGDQVWFDDVSCQVGRPAPEPLDAAGSTKRVPAAAEARGYAFFHVASFAASAPTVRPDDLLDRCQLKSAVCPGEFAAVSLGIYATRAVTDLRIASGDLTGPQGVIQAADVDVRVVKWWRQRRSIWTSQPPPCVVLPDSLIPELLLKDDRWDDSNRPRGFAPEIRLAGPCVTDIPAGTSREIWITAHAPAAAPPGLYKGRLTVTAPGGPTSTVDLTLDVLPFRLGEPGKILGAWVNTGYAFGRDPQTYPDALYERKLQDLRDHGLNSVSILDGVRRVDVQGEWVLDWEPLRKALEYNRRYGLDRFSMFEGFVWATEGTNALYHGRSDPAAQALLLWYVRALNQAVREAEFQPLTYYLIDEPHARANGVRDTRQLGQLVQDAGGRTCTAVTLPTYQAIGPAIDVPILDLGLDTRRYLQSLRDSHPVTSPEHPLLCYWQFWEEHPLLNRYLFGYFLWASGMDGAIPYGYQHVGGEGDPYDDFDTDGKDMFAAYPSRDGPVATLQWEACREGINDLRYVLTLEEALNRAQRRLAAGEPGAGNWTQRQRVRRAQGFLRDLHRRIQILPTTPVEPPPAAQEYALWRETIIAHILALEPRP